MGAWQVGAIEAGQTSQAHGWVMVSAEATRPAVQRAATDPTDRCPVCWEPLAGLGWPWPGGCAH
eukprot:2168747-Alexandrium_andersonii.AAC.1